jgi:hypothetical protein
MFISMPRACLGRLTLLAATLALAGCAAEANPWATGPQPAVSTTIEVDRQIRPRTVLLAVGPDAPLVFGRDYYVCVVDAATGQMTAVLDRDTGEPLKARITSRRRSSPRAMLLGIKPLEVDLRGAVLSVMPPQAILTAGEDDRSALSGED